MKRDIELDFFRGFAIVWVLFIHCIYWTGLFTSDKVTVIKSYLLLEMPFMFLITGAGYALSSKPIKFKTFFSSRISRIIIPYWVYALICVFLIQITVTFLQVSGGISYSSWFLTMGFKLDLWSSVPYLTWHLWFIPVYLLILVILPLLKKANIELKGKQRALPILLLFIVFFLLEILNIDNYLLNYYLKNVLFYSFWIYMGMFYLDFKNGRFKNRYLLIISIVSYVAVYFLTRDMYEVDMQVNKFPPNFSFFMFSLGNMSLLLLLKDYIFLLANKLRITNMFVVLGKKSYTVYLYQSFSFLLAVMILNVFQISLNDHDILGVLYFMVVNILCAYVNIRIFGKVEQIKFDTLLTRLIKR